MRESESNMVWVRGVPNRSSKLTLLKPIESHKLFRLCGHQKKALYCLMLPVRSFHVSNSQFRIGSRYRNGKVGFPTFSISINVLYIINQLADYNFIPKRK